MSRPQTEEQHYARNPGYCKRAHAQCPSVDLLVCQSVSLYPRVPYVPGHNLTSTPYKTRGHAEGVIPSEKWHSCKDSIKRGAWRYYGPSVGHSQLRRSQGHIHGYPSLTPLSPPFDFLAFRRNKLCRHLSMAPQFGSTCRDSDKPGISKPLDWPRQRRHGEYTRPSHRPLSPGTPSLQGATSDQGGTGEPMGLVTWPWAGASEH